MQVTFEAKITDTALYPTLAAFAELYGQVERQLFRDLFVSHKNQNDLKRDYLPRYQITARHFNAIRIMLDGKVAAAREGLKLRLTNLKERLEASDKAIRALEKQLNSKKCLPERKPKLKFKLHQKKRRRAMLAQRLVRAEIAQSRPVPRICFGSNRLFRAQFHLKENGFNSHADWKAEWERARSSQFLCIGSKDETGGNQSCTLLGDKLRLRLPEALGQSKYLEIPGVSFVYGQAVVQQARTAGQALTYRFIRRSLTTRSGKGQVGEAWYVQVTTDRPAAPVTTSRLVGAIGVDLNPKLIAIGEIDRFGNPVETKHYPVQLQGRRSPQVKATLGDAVARGVALAKARGVPIVIEQLDFAKKKAALREKSPRYARMLSAFAYGQFHTLIHSRASREGVEVLEVNPAFTSVIGLVKFKTGYGLSTHAAAAVAIARRGLKFSEGLSTRGSKLSGVSSKTALLVPVRNRKRHVWSDWGRIAKSLRALKTRVFKERSRQSSEGTSGRVTLSTKTGNYPLVV